MFVEYWPQAVYCMNQCLERAPLATKYKLYKAECLAFIGQYQEAQEIAKYVCHLGTLIK